MNVPESHLSQVPKSFGQHLDLSEAEASFWADGQGGCRYQN